MKHKLKSRKFWLTILGSALLSAATQAGLDPELAAKLVTALLGSWILVEGATDIANTK